MVLEFDKNEVLIDALGGDLSSPSWQYRAHLFVPVCFLRALDLTSKFDFCTTAMCLEFLISQYLHTFVHLLLFRDRAGTIWATIYSLVESSACWEASVFRISMPNLLLLQVHTRV